MKKSLGAVVWTFRKQWQYTKVSFLILLLGCLLYVGEQFFALYLPKTVVSGVLAGDSYIQVLVKAGILLGGVFLTEAGINLFGTINYAYFSKFNSEMQYEVVNKSMTLDYMVTESQKFQNLYARGWEALFFSGKHCPLTQLSESSMKLLENILGYLLFGAVLSVLNPWILVILSVTPLIHYFLRWRYNNYVHNNRKHWTPIDRKLEYVVGNSRSFSTAKDIRIYGLNTWFRDMYQSLTKERLGWSKKVMKKSLPVNVSDLLIILVRDGLAYGFLISRVLSGKLGIDEFVLYFTAIGSFANWVNGILEYWSEIHELSLQISDLRAVLEWETAEEEAVIASDQIKTPCDIYIENLSFRYEGAEEDALKNICLHIRAGEKLAIVGQNGAGKTTLVKNICGLYKSENGNIRISGHDKAEFATNDYFRLFSMVFQEFNVLSVSLAEIIASEKKEKVDRKRVEECLKLSGLWEKVSVLPDGMDTPLNKQLYENGIDLSGGEKQKLLLAKAIYKDAPILILDEPTAALDPIAENQMYLRYNELSQGKTSIFISHRLSSTRFCDRIIFLENGQIMEEGSHEELMAKSGKYAEMYRIQSQYYQEEGVSV